MTRPHRPRRRWDLSVVGVVIAAVFLVPYLVMVLGSLKPRSEILRIPPTYLPHEWRPNNYASLWHAPEAPLPYSMISTLAIALCATGLVLVVAGLFGVSWNPPSVEQYDSETQTVIQLPDEMP